MRAWISSISALNPKHQKIAWHIVGFQEMFDEAHVRSPVFTMNYNVVYKLQEVLAICIVIIDFCAQLQKISGKNGKCAIFLFTQRCHVG